MAEVSPGLVTVFGGSGFLGTQVVRALARRGWRVRVAVRRPALAYDLRPLGDVGQIQPIRCDVADYADVAAALRGADAAVNLTGILFETPGRRFRTVHVDGARNIAEAATAGGVRRLVHVSALGADARSPAAYARSKAAGEAAVRAAFPTAVIVRPSVIFGAGDDFLNKFAGLAAFAPALPLIGGGRTRFQPVYVGDAAEAVARCTVRDDVAARTFELGGPAVMTFQEVLKLVLRETNRRRLLLPLPFFAAGLVGSLAQLPALIGLKPVLTADQVALLRADNVVAADADGLADLGIEPTGVEAIVPTYLWRYRRGGQFAARPAL